MNTTSIFNGWLELDCFCLDIAEGWIKYRQSKDKEVSLDAFMEWVMNDLYPSLECSFDDVYEEEFGHREYEDEEG